VEIAKLMGANVIAAASSEEKLRFARDAGADGIINYAETSLRDAVRELTADRGVDVVYDPVGGELAQMALRSLAWHGRYLVIGFACGEIPSFPANVTLLKEASIIGVWWGTWASRNPDESLQNMVELAAMVEDGRLTPRVSESYPLAAYADAFAAITGRRARGKVVLTMA
jgi:NADPH2:quinone reductase